MDFTREPIVETVVTPREGHRLVVRSSKNVGQEEYFVEAVEIVSFGKAQFFRSQERPKPFLVPVTDYEILEVREQRVVLKAPPHDSSARAVSAKESQRAKQEPERKETAVVPAPAGEVSEPQPVAATGEARRRDRRRPLRRRRGAAREEQGAAASRMLEGAKEVDLVEEDIDKPELPKAAPSEAVGQEGILPVTAMPGVFTSILPPPTTLIRDDLKRLRSNELYKGAFYTEREGGAEEGGAGSQEQGPGQEPGQEPRQGPPDSSIASEADETGRQEKFSQDPFRDSEEAHPLDDPGSPEDVPYFSNDRGLLT